MSLQFSILVSDLVPSRDTNIPFQWEPDAPGLRSDLALCEIRYGLRWNYVKQRLTPAYIAYVTNVKTTDIPAVDREYARWKITTVAARQAAYLGLTASDILVHFADERTGNQYRDTSVE